MEKVYWSPWHGCYKISEGCKHCYMMENDAKFRASSKPYRVNSKFNAPVARDRQGNYKWASGTVVATCFNSDFFLEEADGWREEAWDLIRQRPDLDFFIITKRVHRIHKCLPKDWEDGWDNVIVNATVENQKRADERLPVFLNLPLKKKGLAVAPILEEIHLECYLETGEIVAVSVGGESSEQARVCNFDWVRSVREQCKPFGVDFILK